MKKKGDAGDNVKKRGHPEPPDEKGKEVGVQIFDLDK